MLNAMRLMPTPLRRRVLDTAEVPRDLATVTSVAVADEQSPGPVGMTREDVAAIWGLGFPPFRGGPFRYVDEVGADEIVRRLRSFERQWGFRFELAPLLLAMVERRESFHGRREAPPGR